MVSGNCNMVKREELAYRSLALSCEICFVFSQNRFRQYHQSNAKLNVSGSIHRDDCHFSDVSRETKAMLVLGIIPLRSTIKSNEPGYFSSNGLISTA